MTEETKRAEGVEDFTTAVKFAACEWWRRNMPASKAEEVRICRDGRVEVRWKDADEGGSYSLPANFMETLTTPQPDSALVEAARDALDVLKMTAQRSLADPYIIPDLRSLCERHGYGNVMSTASELWRQRLAEEGLAGGEFCSGPCRSTAIRTADSLKTALKTGGA